MRHILPVRVVGEIPNGGLHGARQCGECVCTLGFYQGLAQSIAKPAYRRLLTAEPLLRRAVPVLIIAFLATICVGAIVQVLDLRRQTLGDMVTALDAVADLAAERLQRQPLTRKRVHRRCWRVRCRPGRPPPAGGSC